MISGKKYFEIKVGHHWVYTIMHEAASYSTEMIPVDNEDFSGKLITGIYIHSLLAPGSKRREPWDRVIPQIGNSWNSNGGGTRSLPENL